MGNFEYANNNLTAAASHYEQCINIDKQFLSAQNNLAVVSIRLKDFKRATECYTVCAQLHPEKEEIYLSKIAALLAKQNQSEAAH